MTFVAKWRSAPWRLPVVIALTLGALPALAASAPRVEISFPASVRQQPVTGRVFLRVMASNAKEPGLQVGALSRSGVLFGADVEQLGPGEAAVIDGNSPGFPVSPAFPARSLRELPKGNYDVETWVNVYTQCHRSDGHTVWVHLDQWEGQRYKASPGNLYSDAQQVYLDPDADFKLHLSLSKVFPPIQVPPDTPWVKRIKFQSKLLSEFWGCPIYLGATVLLPKGYEDHPNVRYPAIYLQGHFSLEAPFGFNPEAKAEETAKQPVQPKLRLNIAEPVRARAVSGALVMQESLAEFYKVWTSADFPRVIAVTFQHPTPYYDDSYAVNSANNGPYGDALMKELIPEIEKAFRIIREPYARVLTGGSTGGWESLALQVYHPEFFGGTWTFYPDPVDFRRWGLVNVYEDDNAFTAPGERAGERPWLRRSDGQPIFSIRQQTTAESVLGSRGRSGRQQNGWEAVYGPVDDAGYPKPLWDPASGKIDHSVAQYMKDHGYDLRYYLETNWPKIGRTLVGKLHLICGDMDDWYLNLAVYLLEDFLANTRDPYFAGSFEYGRPMKGHGWQPTTNFELIKIMAEHISKNAPPGADPMSWHYK